MVSIPSAIEFKTRYPEFTAVDDSLVTLMIAEGLSIVDDGWEINDQKPAIMAFTAHSLSMEGYPARASNNQLPLPAGAGREVLMRKVGDVTTQYAQTGSSAGSSSASLSGSLGLTVYGRRFFQLLKLNSPAIGLV
jgi:hypothetical protein